MVSPLVEQELHQQLEHLPLGQHRQVLKFARALASTRTRGVPGKALLPLAGTISALDLAAISQAVEEGCDQVNSKG